MNSSAAEGLYVQYIQYNALYRWIANYILHLVLVYTIVWSNGEGRHCRDVLGRFNLTWCPVYKAGSSNWMRNFAELSGLNVTSRCLDPLQPTKFEKISQS